MEKAVRDWCLALRHSRKLTQDALAAETKISQGLISRLEKDESYDPSVDVLARFARAFGMRLSEFFLRIERKSFALHEKTTAGRDTVAPLISEAIDVPASSLRTPADLLAELERFDNWRQALLLFEAERKRKAKGPRRPGDHPRKP